MPTLRFWIEGKPEPQGSKTSGLRKDGSAFLRDKNPAALKVWRKAVHDGIITQIPPWHPGGIDMPVLARMTFWLPRPKDRPKTIDVWPTVKPDVDKLARAVMDAMTTSGLIRDDSYVVDLHPIKRYAVDPLALPKLHIPGFHRERPGVDLTVSWLD